MARIAGVTLPQNKQIEVALTYIYGIGRSLARKILELTKIEKEKRISQLSESEISSLRDIIEKKYKIEGELRRQIGLNIKRLKDISCYRGIRHVKGLPVRGQRTRTNSRTVRGNIRKTAGSGKRPAPEKT